MERLIVLLDRSLKWFEKPLITIGGVVVLILMLLGCAEVISRTVFNAPIQGNIDMIEQLMVAVAVLGVAFCQSEFGNVRMTMLLHLSTGRRKWFLETFALSIACFVVFVLMKGSWANFLRSWNFGGDTPEIGIPLWIAILTVTVCLGLLLARLAVQLLEALRLLIKPHASSNIFKEFEAEAADFIKEE